MGISPTGTCTFVSSLYTGGISDKEITRSSGILDLIEPGDSVMADKGFDISKQKLLYLAVNLTSPLLLEVDVCPRLTLPRTIR